MQMNTTFQQKTKNLADVILLYMCSWRIRAYFHTCISVSADTGSKELVVQRGFRYITSNTKGIHLGNQQILFRSL